MHFFILQETQKDKIHQWVCKTLSDFLGSSIELKNFSYNDHGKPFLANYPLHFNLSHSYEYAALVVSKSPVGIDIEKIRETIDVTKMAERFFCEQEKALIGNNREKFFKYWVRKEALMKAVGKGLKMGLDAVDVSQDRVIYENEEWEIQNIDLQLPEYKSAVCQKCF